MKKLAKAVVYFLIAIVLLGSLSSCGCGYQASKMRRSYGIKKGSF